MRLLHDLRYAVRALRRTPAFTTTAVATLAIVIGANTAAFSLADTILFKPLPYPQPDRLAMVQTVTRSDRGLFTQTAQDGPAWEAIRDRAPAVDAAAYSDFGGGGVNLVVGSEAVLVRQSRVSAGYFRVLGVSPVRGREFQPEEDRPGGPAVAVLSDELWRRLFHGSEDIVGARIGLRGEPHTVVGVMPRGFRTPGAAEIWTPLRPSLSGEGGGTNYGVIARVKSGATWHQAEGEIAALATPDTFRFRQYRDDVQASLVLTPLQDVLTGGDREPLMMLAAASCAVLLVACVNLAALLVARAGVRGREIATRLALGAGRGTVVRQLLTESLVLSSAGGALGILAGVATLAALRQVASGTFDSWSVVTFDARALAVTAGLTLLTGLIVGVVPALLATRVNVTRGLRDGESRGVAGGSRRWTGRALLIGEVAMGAVLLVLAGLLVRTFTNLRAIDPGFDPRGVITARLSLQDARYASRDSVLRLVDGSLENLSASPAIGAAGVSLGLPYERLLNLGFRFTDVAGDGLIANVAYVTPSFFDALQIPVRHGRGLQDTDRESSPPVVVVNETLSRLYSGDRPIVGRRLALSGAERMVVGVVGDVQQASSGFFISGMRTGPITGTPTIFLPLAQTSDAFLRVAHTWFTPAWVVRARSAGEADRAIREAIASVDPLLPMRSASPMTDVIAGATRTQRLLTTLVGVLAGAAIVLAAIGPYGFIAQGVIDRRREFGIRLALGATPLSAVMSVVRSGVVLASIGVVLGLAGSTAAVRLVESFLWGVNAHDAPTYAGVAALLLATAALASFAAAARILRVSPAETIK